MARRMLLAGLLALGLAVVPGGATAAQTSIEVHWDTLSGTRYVRAGNAPSDFSLGNGPAGSWQLLATAGAPELGFIKTSATGSGTVEVFLDTLSGGSYHRIGDYTSDFSPADAANGTFMLFGSANGAPELGFVKYRHTGASTVEVHWDVLSGNHYGRAGDKVSDFALGTASAGQFELLPGTGTAPQLDYIGTSGTGSGTVELHWDNYVNGAYHRAGDYRSDFSLANAADGVFHAIPDGAAPELGFVKLRGTPGDIEVHWDALSGGSYHRAGDHVSDFSPADAGNGPWDLLPGAGGVPVLGFVKLHSTPVAPPPSSGTHSSSTPVTTVLPRPAARRRHLRVRITISWTWNGRHTRLRRMRVGRMPAGAHLAVSCRGRGCPRPRRRASSRAHIRSLVRRLDGSRYRAGDRITVTVSARGWIGQRALIIVRNGRLPRVRALAPPRG